MRRIRAFLDPIADADLRLAPVSDTALEAGLARSPVQMLGWVDAGRSRAVASPAPADVPTGSIAIVFVDIAGGEIDAVVVPDP